MSTTKTAVIYTRISRDIEGTGLGVERQQNECRQLCEREGYDVVEVITDNDISAYSGRKRPGWERVAELLRSGAVDVLVAWHPDRLTRQPRELEDLVDLLNTAKVKVRTVMAGEYDLTTASGRTTARIVGAVARGESEHKSERLKSKALQTAQAGKTNGGGRPFGYEDDQVTVREDEAECIRWAIQRILDGASCRSICREMWLPPVHAKSWSPNVISRMLMSARLVGLREHHGVIAATAVWPAIVDRADWEQARAILSDPSRKTWRPAERYLLSGGLIEDHLGRKMIARPDDRGRRCYISLPDELGPGLRIGAEEVEAMVVEARLRLADETPDIADLAGGETSDDVIAQLDRLGALYGSGAITEREWLAARGPLVERLAAVAPTPRFVTQNKDLRKRWNSLSITVRREVVAAAIGRVVIGPGRRGYNRFDPARVQIVPVENS